jgi:tetratricopeptide (TPR) repeat protein
METSGPDIILDQVRRLVVIPPDAAPEGVIFYCARMLDGICAALVVKLGQKPSANIFSNLMTVEALRLIDNISKELAHTLRRMGNIVRHSLADSTLEDVKLAVVLTRELLDWFEALEAGAQFGQARAALDAKIDPDWGVVSVVGLLAGVEAGNTGDIEALLARRSDILTSRFLASLCAEALIACGRPRDAEDLLAACADRFGSDQRHQQLSALVLSRTGRLEEAVKAADAMLKRYPDDDETSGIAGGIYKRRWDRDPTQTQSLKKAHELYKKQWEKGKRINAYLGVNAASTSVYLGELDAARAIAAEVVTAMAKRDAALSAAKLTPQDGGLSAYYDEVSRAEAMLVSGDAKGARATYDRAFATYRQYSGTIKGAKAQAMKVAALSATLDFEPWPYAMGVTGHRPHKLNADGLARIAADIGAVFDDIAAKAGGRKIACVTSLAEGADTMAAEAALARGWSVIAPLPFPADLYALDFAEGTPRDTFLALLAKSEHFVCRPDRQDDVAGYRAASSAMLDLADTLVAVWDGEATEALGGAYDTLREAGKRGLEAIRIDARAELPPAPVNLDEKTGR